MGCVTVSILLIFTTDFFIAGTPINKGLSVKFKPIHTKDEIHPKTFGTLFAKIPQEMTPEAIIRRELLSKTIAASTPELGIGFSNQIARRMYPIDDISFNMDEENNTKLAAESVPFVNLPIMNLASHKDYKVLVAAAPPELKLGNGEDSQNLLVYIIFPGSSGETESDEVSLPKVYFVNKVPQQNGTPAGKPPDNILLVNNNRTVTGITSKQVAKFLKFKNKLVSRYDYSLVP